MFSPERVAAQEPSTSKYKIAVNVSGEESFSHVLQSAVMRELRKLDSVEVVDAKDAEYELSLVTVKTSRSYAMSALLTSKTDLTWTLYFSKNDACHPTDEQQKETRELLQDYVLVHDLWVFTDSDIQSLASRVAAAVDVNDVERFRQIMRRIEEYRKKRPR